MTLSEFKAWFDGYTEGVDNVPDAKQWDRIKARVGEIDQAVSDRVRVPNRIGSGGFGGAAGLNCASQDVLGRYSPP